MSFETNRLLHCRGGRRTVTIAAGLLLIGGVCFAGDEPGGPSLSSASEDGAAAVTAAVNAELRDLARALRRLDQSYAIRGIRGAHAATAGSVSIDWVAKEVPPGERPRAVPPPPLDLSRSCRVATPVCPTCPTAPGVTAAGCAACGGASAAGAAACGCGQASMTIAPCHPVVFPAPVYTRSMGGRACGGRTPPFAMRCQGGWAEPTGLGTASYGTVEVLPTSPPSLPAPGPVQPQPTPVDGAP